jgi:hypothetical protein
VDFAHFASDYIDDHMINVWPMITQLKLIPILLPSMFLKPSIRNRQTSAISALSLAGWILTLLRILWSIPHNTRGYKQAPLVPSVPLIPRLTLFVEMKQPLVTNVYGVKTDKKFINTLEDNITNHGAPH